MAKYATIIVSAFLLTLILRSPPVEATPGDIHVPYDYPTIQAAVNAATPGDTVIVHSGTYFEHITIDKQLVLTGVDLTAIIDGGGTGTVINATSSGVVITGLRIQNAGDNWTQRDSGIFVGNKQFCQAEFNHIENCRLGIYLQDSSHIEIVGNILTNNPEGIRLERSTHNNINHNSIVDNDYNLVISTLSNFNGIKSNYIADASSSGIHIQTWSTNNTIYGNEIKNCSYGVLLSQSDSNIIYHNSFIENTDQAWLGSSLNNEWNIDWPDGGNYWSDHTNSDVKSGEYQMGPGSDGISDSPYNVDAGYMDKYPCAGPVNYFTVEYILPEDIVVISNSSISEFQMNTTERTMAFHATGNTGVGFSRADIPNTIVSGLWDKNYQVFVNGLPIAFGNWTEGSRTYIYFRYTHSTSEIMIIPEAMNPTVLGAFMMATIVLAVVSKRRTLSA